MRDWEKCYQAGETPWDHGSAAPPLLEVIERHGVALWGGGPVLVPGCGLGHDVRVLAGLGLPVLGLDIAETAVALASGIPAVGGETYACGDFLDPAWRVGREFSAVWEHTCFCAIDPALRQAYAEATAGLLGAGQVLVGVFYLTPEMASECCESSQSYGHELPFGHPLRRRDTQSQAHHRLWTLWVWRYTSGIRNPAAAHRQLAELYPCPLSKKRS